MILIVSLSVLFSLYLNRNIHLPDIITFEEDIDCKYTIRIADENSERILNSLTSNYYGEYYVDDDEVESWRKKNPNAFLMLYNQNDNPCGDITILGLESNFMELLIKGSITDTEIKADKILSFEETKSCPNLYITGILVVDPLTAVGRKRALALIWGTIQYLKKYYLTTPKKKIYAVAITKESENLMKKLGFQIEGIASRRVDRHILFSLVIDKENLQKVANRIGDYSRLCKVQI